MAHPTRRQRDADLGGTKALDNIFTYLERRAIERRVITKKQAEKWHREGYWTSYDTIEEALVKAYVNVINDPDWDGSY